MKVPLAGCPVTTRTNSRPGYIVVHGTAIYWTVDPCHVIMKLGLGGGLPETLYQTRSAAGGLAAHGGNVYRTSIGDTWLTCQVMALY